MHALVVDALSFTLLVGLAFMPLEHLVPARPGRTSFRTDLAFATIGLVLVRVLLVAVVGTSLAELDRFAPEQPLVRIADPLVRSIVEVAVGLAVFELVGYAYHRLAHAVPWMWRIHEVHHSSESMDWLASFRQHPIEIVLTTLAQNAPLVMLGIPFGSHALVLVLLRLNTVYVHSNLAIPDGAFGRWIATPRFHHRHHQRLAPRESTSNFAVLFPVIDRLFGTFDARESTAHGLETAMPTSFTGLLWHPFAQREGSRGRRATPSAESVASAVSAVCAHETARATSDVGATTFSAVSPSQHSA